MKFSSTIYMIIFFIPYCVYSFEPISAMSAVVAGLLSIAYNQRDRIICIYECCANPWITNDYEGMERTLKHKIYGQHLAIDIITKSIRAHRVNSNPQKPLVLSLHGWTGSGKNYVSSIIAESLYKEGLKSKFVHLLIATLHFPHISLTPTYSDDLRKWLRGNATYCPYQFFILDEVDFMSNELVNTLKPFLDYHQLIDGIDFRHSIFLLLSNSGGSEIAETALAYWDEGRNREDITLADLDEILSKRAFNEKGGLYKSSLLDRHLIDFFVPFLPLERKHVKRCAWDSLDNALSQRLAYERRTDPQAQPKTLSQAQKEKVVDDVTNSLSYYPNDRKIYSTSGCKRVHQKVDLILERLFSS